MYTLISVSYIDLRISALPISGFNFDSALRIEQSDLDSGSLDTPQPTGTSETVVFSVSYADIGARNYIALAAVDNSMNRGDLANSNVMVEDAYAPDAVDDLDVTFVDADDQIRIEFQSPYDDGSLDFFNGKG